MSRISRRGRPPLQRDHRPLALDPDRLRRDLVRLPGLLIRRDLAGGVGGTLAAIAMFVLGLWIVHQPRESVGRLATSPTKSRSARSAPRNRARSADRSAATPKRCPRPGRDWSRFPLPASTSPTSAGRSEPPPPEAVKRADAIFCDDIGALTTLSIFAHLGSSQAQEQCARFARKRYGRPAPGDRPLPALLTGQRRPRSALELLRQQRTNTRRRSPPRAATGPSPDSRCWPSSRSACSARSCCSPGSRSASSPRLRSPSSSSSPRPLALFFPLLGDSGRRAFKAWGLTLLGAIARQGDLRRLPLDRPARHLDPRSRRGLRRQRHRLPALLRLLLGGVPQARRADRADLGRRARASQPSWHRRPRRPRRAQRGLTHRRPQHPRLRESWRLPGAASARLSAPRQRVRPRGARLRTGARALAEHRYREARETVAAHEAAHLAPARAPPSRPGRLPGRSATARTSSAKGAGRRRQKQQRRPATSATVPPELCSPGAERNQQRLGQRWSRRDLARFAAEDRELLQTLPRSRRSRSPRRLRRAQFEQLRGPRARARRGRDREGTPPRPQAP